MLKKIKTSIIISNIIAVLMFVFSLFAICKLPVTPQAIVHFITDWFTIISLGITFLIPFFVKCKFLIRFLVSSSSLFMLCMYILYKIGFETIKEVVSMCGFNIATSYRSIVIIFLFIVIVGMIKNANKYNS